MLGKAVITLMLLASAGFANVSGAAEDPTLHQVYEAAQAGRLNEAQAMMDKVLRDHPNSAKAHFVEAELFAKQGQISSARSELNTAEHLAPGLPFAKPQAVDNLRNRIASSPSAAPLSSSATTLRAEASSGVPWGMLLLGGGLIAAVVYFARSMSRRNATYIPAGTGSGYAGPGYGPQGNVPTPYGPGGMAPPMGPSGGGIGSGIMGGLATGAALGAGMVAGEALMHHFTDGNRTAAGTPPPVADAWSSSNAAPNDMGGSDFGVADSSSWDDSSGGGGDDWS